MGKEIKIMNKIDCLQICSISDKSSTRVSLPSGTIMTDGVKFNPNISEEVGRAEFNVATPTYVTVTCTRHVQHTYYHIIYKQNQFNIISRGVQGCISTDFRLK